MYLPPTEGTYNNLSRLRPQESKTSWPQFGKVPYSMRYALFAMAYAEKPYA